MLIKLSRDNKVFFFFLIEEEEWWRRNRREELEKGGGRGDRGIIYNKEATGVSKRLVSHCLVIMKPWSLSLVKELEFLGQGGG